ncbi:RNA polymerase sigma factor [Pseudobutyrivibrio sp.]|uniref:RNA polymerase sigma factor n=1 Tax=Pseudobutyrivibrio sp. TaxID=2014367 RepID=UPI0025F0BBEF|nr:sigma-70 family RNA polymerase sigma factor [Pseudobutyrivibrio sp.]
MLVYLMLIDGDEQRKKFSEIYEENKSLLYNIALSVIKDDVETENIVHDVFVKLAENFEKYSSWDNIDIRKLSVTIVKNKSIDFLRKQKHVSDEDLEELVLYNNYIDYEPEPVSEKNYNQRMIVNLMLKLPELQKEILELKYYHELTNKEISKILGISPKNVEVRLYRARNKMKELIENEKF